MSMKQKVINMITEANTTTGESDTNLTDAVASLIDGYGGSTPTGTKTITDTSLTDVADYANAQVVDSDLIPSNIKKDVNILGVTGTFEGGGGGMQYATGSFTPTSLISEGQYDIVDISDIGFTPKVFFFMKNNTSLTGIRMSGFATTNREKPYFHFNMYKSGNNVLGAYVENTDISAGIYVGINGTKIAIECSSSKQLDANQYIWHAYA